MSAASQFAGTIFLVFNRQMVELRMWRLEQLRASLACSCLLERRASAIGISNVKVSGQWSIGWSQCGADHRRHPPLLSAEFREAENLPNKHESTERKCRTQKPIFGFYSILGRRIRREYHVVFGFVLTDRGHVRSRDTASPVSLSSRNVQVL